MLQALYIGYRINVTRKFTNIDISILPEHWSPQNTEIPNILLYTSLDV